MIIINFVIALLLYLVITYNAYQAYYKFEFMFSSQEGDIEAENNSIGNRSNNRNAGYGSVQQDNGIRNRGDNIYGFSGGNSNNAGGRGSLQGGANQRPGFVPFSGRGTSISGNNNNN